MSVNIKPIGDRVLVKYIEEEEEQSRGGIIIPDRVLISKYGGTEVKLNDEKFMLVREDDILGIISWSDKISNLKIKTEN